MLLRTKDTDRIKKILLDQELFDRVSDDGFYGELLIKEDDNIYLINDKDTALFIFEPFTSICWWLHVNVLRHDRGMAKEYTNDAISWAFTNGAEKLIASIPEVFPDVIGFAKKMGFTRECVITNSIKKKGIMYNQVIFSLEKMKWDLLEN